jgi:hypothetical protein
MAGSHSDPNAPEPKPSVVRKDLVPLKPIERIASGIIALIFAIASAAYITAIRTVDQAAESCGDDCVVTVNQLPEPAIALGLLAFVLVFSLFAATGYVWSIKTSVFETSPSSKDAEVLPNDSPTVQHPIAL